MIIYLVNLAYPRYEMAYANTNVGAMVLGRSLRDNGTQKELAVLVTLDNLQASTIDELKVRRKNQYWWHFD